MKFAICIVALALMATIEAAPAPVGTYGDGSDPPVLASVYFENNLDGIQGALTDIEAAGIDLATIKPKKPNLPFLCTSIPFPMTS